jgi:hypothetical protein
MDEALMARVEDSLNLKRSIEERGRARRDARLASLDPLDPQPGITHGYHSELVWPREDLQSARQAIIEAVAAGHSDTRLLQQYAVAKAAVEPGRAKHAFLRLINDGALKFGASLMETLPGPNFPSPGPLVG